MFEVTVDLYETLTPKSCAKLVIHLIKYVLYHSEQIPMNYEALNNILKKFQMSNVNSGEGNGFSSFDTLSKMKAHQIYKSIDLLLSSCENTFKYLECELTETKGIRELVVIVGATVLSPKKVIRIVIPNMSFIACENDHPPGRNLHSLCKHIVMSDSVNDYFRDKVSPTNIFIFLKMLSSCQPKTEGFLLKEGFKYSRQAKEIKIYLEQPKSNPCVCLDSVYLDQDRGKQTIGDSDKLLQTEDLFTWYQSKGALKGLKVCNGRAANSVFSLLLKNKS